MNEIEMEKKFENHDLRIKQNEDRLNKLESVYTEIKDLTLSVNSLSISIKNLVDEQKEISNRLNVIEKQPADKYHALIKQITTIIVSGLGGAIIAAIIKLL